MIIDSHVHYSRSQYDGEYSCLAIKDGDYTLMRTERDKMLCEMRNDGIVGFIEPSIELNSIGKQIVIDERYGIWKSLGVHPTRCVKTEWKCRKKLSEYTANNRLVAIGETGLDYHGPRKMQFRLRQKKWFVYQIKLADRLNLPLILHVRMADSHALKILKRYKTRLHGGVAHCFCGDSRTAKAYIDLGFSLGIGAKLLLENEQGMTLQDTIKSVPLSSLLVETDAPYVLPNTDKLSCSKNQRKKLINSSFILPELIRKIAEIKEESYDTVENIIYRNTIRVFNLDIDEVV